MSREAVARELTDLIARIQGLADRAVGLADNSGGMVSGRPYRAILSATAVAAGELHQQGLLHALPEQIQKLGPR